MESSAFSRVRSLFRYSRPTQWAAILSGIATAILFALLLLLLGLFVDLLVTRGRIPNFAQLSVREQDAVLEEWSALPDEDRVRALAHVGFSDMEAARGNPVIWPEMQYRLRVYEDLKGVPGID